MSELRRIGLNLLFLVPGETGGSEVYIRNLIPRLAEQRPELELLAFVNREGRELDLGGIEVIPHDVSGRSRARRALAEQRPLRKLIAEHDVDLVHSPGTPSVPGRLPVPSVVTIHDLIWAHHPEDRSFVMNLGIRTLVARSARKADRIITDSQASATDLVEMLDVAREKIDVVPLGGKPPGPGTDETELRGRLGLGDSPLVLSVSARLPHKNLSRLMAAFASLQQEPLPLLVLPGYDTGFESGLEAETARLGIADRVRFLGWVSDEDLEGLYAAASCFAYPSITEGFGMPVLEALERGVPVACSSTSALPEVAGDAARYFDPLQTDEIAAALRELLEREGLREELAKAGPERARTFSWQRTATGTLESYERAWADRSA